MTFWTHRQFDAIGSIPSTAEWRDDLLVQAFKLYHKRTYGERASTRGDCFIATAAFRTELAREVPRLRRWRDETLRSHRAGRVAIPIYACISPALARSMRRQRRLAALARTAIRFAMRLCIAVARKHE